MTVGGAGGECRRLHSPIIALLVAGARPCLAQSTAETSPGMLSKRGWYNIAVPPVGLSTAAASSWYRRRSRSG